MGGGGGGASCKLKRVAMKLLVQTCGSFCERQQNHVLDNSAATPVVSSNSSNYSSPPENQRSNISCKKVSSEIVGHDNSRASLSSNKSNLCTICLDPLNYNSGSSVFTAQCSHAFHFACISSNVRHGSVTCPICRARWTQLPHNPNNARHSLRNKTDPVLHILDDSIANFRVHRGFEDDDPIEPDRRTSGGPRLSLSLLDFPRTYPSFDLCPHQASISTSCPHCEILSHTSYFVEESPRAALEHHVLNNRVCLRVKLQHRPPTDLVLVATPVGPHLRLMKQAMALVVFSLQPFDRLAIVTYSSSASASVRVFPLRLMTSYGKRSALQVIDRAFYMAQTDPMEGLKKGVKILEDRAHKNVRSDILHLTDNSPSRSYRWFDSEVQFTIHRFNVGLGFGACNGFIVHEFEEFLARTLGGVVEDIQLRIGEGTMIVRIRELRGGEERNIPIYIGQRGHVYVEYSYRDGGDGECIRTGEIVLGVEDKGDGSDIRNIVPIERRLAIS